MTNPEATAAAGAPVGILLSGRGSNFLALHQAMGRGEVAAHVAIVVSDLADAPGLELARELGLPAVACRRSDHPSREAQEEAIAAALAAHGVRWVCLAGFMRLLSAAFVRRFRERIVNIHPSLLPAFPGLHAQRQAIEHGVRVSGCTVHLVDEGLDNGPIVVQRSVPVLPGDDEAALSARILVEEHRAYPEALRRLLAEPWHVDGRRLVFGS